MIATKVMVLSIVVASISGGLFAALLGVNAVMFGAVNSGVSTFC